MLYLDERCGAWQVGEDSESGPVRFRIFLPTGPDPQIASIRAAGDFQVPLGGHPWDYGDGIELVADRSDPRGWFWTATTDPLPKGFYQYKYLVRFTDGRVRYVSDPCARYGGLSDLNAAVVVGGDRLRDSPVTPIAGGRKPLADLVVYELMIDDFTAADRGDRAPLDVVRDRLDYLTSMGFNAILFMPWTAWRNRDFDWGYAPFQYFAVESRYADEADHPENKLIWLRELVNACHERGIHVIMDGVYNHTSRDFPYPQFYRDPKDCPFTDKAFGGQFAGLQDLDFGNACTLEFITDVCRYWIGTFGLDGIRFDNTVNYYLPGDLAGLPELLAGIQSWLEARGEVNFSLTLEHIRQDAASVTNATVATSFWDNALFELAFSESSPDGRIDGNLLNALNNRRYLSPGKVPTVYLGNHDHSQLAWRIGAPDRESGETARWWLGQPWLIALYASTGVPLIPNGQEFGENHYLPEDDHHTGRRVASRPLRWQLADDPIGRPLRALHAALARARRDHPALRSELMYPSDWAGWQTRFNQVGVGVDVERQLAIFHRWAPLAGGAVENVVVVLNFAGYDQIVPVPFPTPGLWTDLLAG
ncbi:MAG TPA: alpha-amylase family glycosyl hydrolase, partial [Jatrophihabitans sp.]|nr:alpha-amylase family glycosyl hydrolase [Jatrophihabitans sp.]